jgi:hypothetical protein
VDAPHGRGSGFALYVTFAARDRSRALLRTFHIVKERSRLEPRSRRRRPEPISNAIALHGTCKINQSEPFAKLFFSIFKISFLPGFISKN